MNTTLLLLGCGNMGYAMLRGWRAAFPKLPIHVVEPNPELRERAAALDVEVSASAEDLRGAADLIVAAVKPGLVAPVLSSLPNGVVRTATVLSVAAGVSIDAMARALPPTARVVRCMPNTPAAMGAGMLVLCAGPGVPAASQDVIEALMQSSGITLWINDEAQMDAVTAISGSGPAYVFHMTEALAEAGIRLGLPSEVASVLAMQTIYGAGRMVAESGVGPDTLRAQVTSPNGTTAAALDVLMEDQALIQLMSRAAEAAHDRSVALGAET